MEKELILEHLALAKRQAEEGEIRIAGQKHIIALLSERGQDTTQALSILANFETAQNNRLAAMNRLLNALDDDERSYYPMR